MVVIQNRCGGLSETSVGVIVETGVAVVVIKENIAQACVSMNSGSIIYGSDKLYGSGCGGGKW